MSDYYSDAVEKHTLAFIAPRSRPSLVQAGFEVCGNVHGKFNLYWYLICIFISREFLIFNYDFPYAHRSEFLQGKYSVARSKDLTRNLTTNYGNP